MTLEARAARLLDTFPLTARQAHFVTLVALMSGYCLRRQYSQFAGIALGKNAAAFLEQLVARNLATRQQPRPHRSFLYHIRQRGLYELLGLANHPHRRPASPTRQARRLMLLDFAIAERDVIWYVTEADKTALMASTLGISVDAARTERLPLPIHQPGLVSLPIYQRTGRPTIVFIHLGLDTSGQGLSTFLTQHEPLLRRLPAWEVVVVYPTYLRSAVSTWRRTVDRAHLLERPILSPADARELHAYFRVHHALIDRNSAASVTIDHAHEARRRRFTGSRFHALYPFWCAAGGPHCLANAPPDFTRWQPAGAFTTHELPHTYDLFGSFPGLA